MMPAMPQIATDDTPQAGSRRTIPYDYAFRYKLTGEPGRVLKSTVTVSIEAPFVAVSIGYGVIPEVTAITFGPDPDIFLYQQREVPPLRELNLGHLLGALKEKLAETGTTLKAETGPEAVFKNGLKLNPEFAELVLLGVNDPYPPSLPAEILKDLFQVVGSPPEQIQFLYALFDEGSGREFQSEPILNIAGLGISNGDRPFRYFARPITFAPRSTIRMEVTEVSDFTGELQVSLQGYKILGGAGTPTDIRRGGPTRGRRRR
jgi:hypothetical protein